MIGLIRQDRFACGRERPALDLGRDCSFAKRVVRPPERMDSSASLSCAVEKIFGSQTANSFQSSRSVAASRNLNLCANVQVEFHRQSTSYFRDRNKMIACGQSFVAGAVGFKTAEFYFMQGFGLRSASGESGAESGEERLAERSQSATPAAEPQTEARRSLRPCTMQARDERAVCGVERASSRGRRGDGQPVERSKPRVGHGAISFTVTSS